MTELVTREQAAEVARTSDGYSSSVDVVALAETVMALYDRAEAFGMMSDVAEAVLAAQDLLFLRGNALLVRDERGTVHVRDLVNHVIVRKPTMAAQ